MDTPPTRAGETVGADTAATKVMEVSKASIKATAVEIIMDVATEVAAEAVVEAVEAVETEASWKQTPTIKLNLESSRNTAGRTAAIAATKQF